MSRDIEIIIRRTCRHGDSHPHSWSQVSSTGEPIQVWCTEGDHRKLLPAELERRVFAVLTEKDPRIELDKAEKNAEQILDELRLMVREGAITEKI